MLWVAGSLDALAMLAAAVPVHAICAEDGLKATGIAEGLPPAQVFTLLFLMLGPFKIVGTYTQLTQGANKRQAQRLACRSIAFASAALLLAGFLGRTILESYRIPVPTMALTGGLILFLVALKTLLDQFQIQAITSQPVPAPFDPSAAIMPLAFPTIVTPYGVAALVVLMAVSPDLEARLVVGEIVVAIMLGNLLIMLLAHKILPVMRVVLPILGAVLGVVQVALGLQIIKNALVALGVL